MICEIYRDNFEIYVIEAVEYEDREGKLKYYSKFTTQEGVPMCEAVGFNSLPECLEALSEISIIKGTGWKPLRNFSGHFSKSVVE